MSKKEILIFSELTPDFKIQKVVFELCAAAKKISSKLDNAKISAVIISKNSDFKDIIKQLASQGFDKVYIIKDDSLENYSTILYTDALCR